VFLVAISAALQLVCPALHGKELAVGPTCCATRGAHAYVGA
jgi:hypothetical protein